MRPALVIGLGQSDRGDDGVGPAVTRRVRELHLPVTVIEEADPAGLLDAWAGAGLVVVTDAVRSGRPPGTVHVLHAGHTGAGAGVAAWGGTHAFGLAEALELGQALRRMPAELVVVGVEAQHFRLGEPMSPPVRAAVAMAARVVSVVVQSAVGNY